MQRSIEFYSFDALTLLLEIHLPERCTLDTSFFPRRRSLQQERLIRCTRHIVRVCYFDETSHLRSGKTIPVKYGTLQRRNDSNFYKSFADCREHIEDITVATAAVLLSATADIRRSDNETLALVGCLSGEA